MFLNSEEIVQQVRAEFEATVAFVLDPCSSAPTADAVERSLLRRLLGLGRSLLRLYFVHQARQHTAQSAIGKEGQVLPYPSEKGRSYPSIFGRVYFCAHRGSEAVGRAADVQTPPEKDPAFGGGLLPTQPALHALWHLPGEGVADRHRSDRRSLPASCQRSLRTLRDALEPARSRSAVALALCRGKRGLGSVSCLPSCPATTHPLWDRTQQHSATRIADRSVSNYH